MFKGLYTRLLQHLVAQNSWANTMLQPFAGKSVQFNVGPFSSSLVILENGSLAMAGETNIPDASISISPSLLLRLVTKDESAKLLIKVEGDTHLASELAKVLNHMRWDYEDDLSQLVGDIPANKLGELGRKTTSVIKETGINLAEMLSEYWQEEKPMIAKKRHVEQFNAEVDILRADVERFEKRLNKLNSTVHQAPNSINSTTDNAQ